MRNIPQIPSPPTIQISIKLDSLKTGMQVYLFVAEKEMSSELI